MTPDFNYLIVRYDPAKGGTIRAIAEKFKSIICGKRQWQNKDSINLILTLARPDTDDEGAKTSFQYSTGDLVRELEAASASVEKREKMVA